MAASTPQSVAHFERGLIAFTLLVLAMLFIYRPGLSGPLIMDDRPTFGILLDPTEDTPWSTILWSHTGALGRPLSMLTFMANAATTQDAIWAFKLSNVLLHAVNGCLLYVLLLRLLSVGGRERRPSNPMLAALLTGVWLLHPLQVSTVLYVVQRMTMLSATFVLLGLIAVVSRQREGLSDWRQPAISLGVCFIAASLAKENGVLLLPLAWWVLWFIQTERPLSRAEQGLMRVLLGLNLLGVLCAGVWFAHALGGPLSESYLARGWSPLDRLSMQAGILWHYLGQMLTPLPSRLTFFYDDWPITSAHFGVAPLAWGILLLVALVFRQRLPWLVLGVAFYLVGHALESTLLPLELVFEHRNYLPMIGPLLVLLTVIDLAPVLRAAVLPISLMLILVLSLLSASRITHWSTPEKFVLHAYELRPNSYRVASTLVDAALAQERPELAFRAIANLPGPGPAIQRLMIRCYAGQNLQTADIQQQLPGPFGLRMDPYNALKAVALMKLARTGDCEFPLKAYAHWLAALAEDGWVLSATSRAQLALAAAEGFWQVGDKAAARVQLTRQALALDPPRLNLLAAYWAAESGDCVAAARHWSAVGSGVTITARRVFQETRELAENALRKAGCASPGQH